MTLSVIAVPSVAMRAASQSGTCPPWSGRSAVPERFMTSLSLMLGDPISSFMEAASVPLEGGHASGTLDRARAILDTHTEVAAADIYAAAVLGDETAVRKF